MKNDLLIVLKMASVSTLIVYCGLLILAEREPGYEIFIKNQPLTILVIFLGLILMWYSNIFAVVFYRKFKNNC